MMVTDGPWLQEVNRRLAMRPTPGPLDVDDDERYFDEARELEERAAVEQSTSILDREWTGK